MSQRLHKLTSGKFFFRRPNGGRNNQGVTTVFHKGGGNRKLYRIIDFKRSLFDCVAVVKKIEYDPNRTSHIALICYESGILAYILAPRNLMVGDRICAGLKKEIAIGNALPIKDIPTGTSVHNVELKPGCGGQLSRAAGTCAKIVQKDARSVVIRLRRRGPLFSLSKLSMATIGQVSCVDHKNIKLKKAGQSRWKGIRPTVRGIAMNPVDHPHGGGEGRSKGGNHPVSPWGKLTKGKATSFRRISTRSRRRKFR